MSNHTPAPWEIEIDWEDRHPIAIIDPTTKDHPQGPLHICNVNPNLQDESAANAALIAAAPELLEALKEMMSSYEAVMAFAEPHQNIDYVVPKPVKEMGWERWEAARAAIAKAEG